ncbi:MAG: LPP20 family lipoprotein [Candidatus Cloacimonetes bacterium]|nr:LPP20 family lipoprotein [Candidatus Cloacimonadota bacterium]
MKPLVLLIILLGIFNNILYSQNLDSIQNAGNYLYGIGEGKTFREADKNALDNLISQISVHVESKFKNIVTEKNEQIEEYTKIVVNTYSNTTLPQTRSRVIEEKPDHVKVIRYMKEENMKKIFSERKNKIFDYTQSAIEAEKEDRIGDALKYYYWALVLLRSHPDHNNISYQFPQSNKERILLSALPARINRLFSNINIDVQHIEENEEQKVKTVLLNIAFKGDPVQNFDYIYWMGNTWSGVTSSRDGLGYVKLYGAASKSLSNIRLKAEYMYENKSALDLELREVMNKTEIPYFAKAEYKIPLSHQVVSSSSSKSKEDQLKIRPLNFEADTRIFKSTLQKIIKIIEEKSYSRAKHCFTQDGYKMFEKLVDYGNAEVLNKTPELKIVELNENYIIRSIPMKFSFKNNRRDFIEDVVFTFNKEQKIDCISFALSDKSINDIMEHEKWPELDKYHLVWFMENYKTAYALERLNYIESIFSDNALIIVGKVLKKAERIDGMYKNLKDYNIKYIRLNKKEYIKRLKRVFRSNEFVNIQFEDNQVKKRGRDDIYGIQIAQNYYSTHYADKGYLFLMFDLANIKKPRIYVRSWQPKKNKNGSIIGLSDFYF